MAKYCKTIFLLLFSSGSLIAQNNDIKFEHLSIDHGLSNNIVYRIIQDSRGFMWFATEDGLNKYDGYNFTVYRYDPEDSLSISDNLIWTLQESHYGDKHVLWIGTKYGGLNRLDLETEQFRHFKNDPDDPQSLSNNWVVSICEDSFGDLWIGTNGGTNIFNRETEKFVRYQNDPKDPNSLSHNINSTICESLIDGTSILWIGTKAGLNKFDRKTGKFIRYQHDRYNLNSLSYNLIEYLYADSSGTLWITTNNGGLNKFNIRTEQFTRFEYDPNNKNGISSNMTGTILEDTLQGKKVLWVDSFNGLNRLDLETEQFTHFKHSPGNSNSLSDNRLWTTYKDKTGMIWIGTFGGGLNKFDPGRLKFFHLRQETGNLNSLSHNVITSITESEYYGPNVFWIGTRDRGLNKYDRNIGRFTHYRHDPDNANSLINDLVYTILESSYRTSKQ
jgi:ligand-binding sensor domain-containing protein